MTPPDAVPPDAVALTPESEAMLADFGYHTPDCDVTAEDNCTCDLRDRLAAIEAAALTRHEDALREARQLATDYATLSNDLRDALVGLLPFVPKVTKPDVGPQWQRKRAAKVAAAVAKARAALAAHDAGGAG